MGALPNLGAAPKGDILGAPGITATDLYISIISVFRIGYSFIQVIDRSSGSFINKKSVVDWLIRKKPSTLTITQEITGS